jgi:DNA-binding SARP family transcriptional activator/Flp pilus assembly protein TadD
VTGIEFYLLGPMLVRSSGVVIPVPGGKLRAVLAALLLAQGRAVSLEDLAETLWGPEPPPTARVTIQNHVLRLRRALGAESARIATRPPGYLIRVDASELDVSRFERRLSAAQAAARNQSWEAAAREAREALGLWRGEPLADVDSGLLATREAPRLAEMRLQALETRINADLHLGRHDQLVPGLQSLAAQHPLREHFHGQLMLALYRCGRAGEALEAFQRARRVLVDELGIEPGAELRGLQEKILAADPALTTPSAHDGELAAGAGQSRVVVPRQPKPAEPVPPRELPPVVAGFTGRSAELAALTALLDQPGQVPEAVVISAIGGTAGVGKTALAVQWAHRTAGRFPAGQLYVNLRGYDPDRPVPAADALAGFLRSLGVPGQDIPPEPGERAARYRSLLAGKRMLIVLDNAGSADQVRPLLPGTPTCMVVVTSRDTLAGLVARDGAARLDLDLLPEQDAVALLRTLIGTRVNAEPAAAAELARYCCHLPLALRVAAELAATRPDVPLAALTSELADLRTRLDLLDAHADPRTQVRTVFSWSYRNLDPETARAFRLAGLHPGPDLEPYAAAALTGTTQHKGRQVLGALARAHLIQSPGSGRFGMHDLLRGYACELADAQDGEDGEKEKDAALTRLFDHYLHSASTAMDILHPAACHLRPRVPPPASSAPPLTEPTAARAWLDAERGNLVAVTVHAARHGWPTHATQLSQTLFRYLNDGGHYPEALTIHSHAHAAGQHTGDRAAEALALNCLGGVHYRQSRYQQAADRYQQALVLFRQLGDRTAQGRALVNLGIVHYFQGRYREATDLSRQALAICQETGDRFLMANTLINLGISEQRRGRYDLAARHHRQALVIAKEIGAGDLECIALCNLGTVGMRQGRYQQAAGHLDRSLAMSREAGDRDEEAEALIRIGELSLRQGRPEEAARHLREALALYQELGSPSGEADARNSLGEVLLASGQADHACAEHDAALALAAQAGDKYQQARARHGLAQACHAAGNPGQGRPHWQQALDLFTELGTPEAGEVRACLANLD